MFQDEARFGRISDVRRCWCPKPARPLCMASVSQEYAYAYAAVSIADGQMDSLMLPHVNTLCMQVFLDEVAARHPDDRIVMVLDGAGWHRAHALCVPPNLRLLPLPPYAPELNPVEHIWGYLKENELPNLCPRELWELSAAARSALRRMRRRPTLVTAFWKQAELF